MRNVQNIARVSTLVVLAFALTCFAGCGTAIWYPVDKDGKAYIPGENTKSTPGVSNTALTLTVPVSSVVIGGQVSITATGGKTPYRFSMVSGGGSIEPNDGKFTAAAPAGASIVRVTDADQKISEAAILVR